MCWNSDKKLVQESRKNKNDDLRQDRRDSTADHRGVDVPFHEVVNWLVPARPVDSNAS